MFFMLLILFPSLNHFFLLSFSFLQLSAVEEEAVPFVWLYVSSQLNLLLFDFCIFSLLSRSALPPNFHHSPPSKQPLGHAVSGWVFHVQGAGSACHSSQHHLPHLLRCFRAPRLFDVPEGRGEVLHKFYTQTSSLPSITAVYLIADTWMGAFPFYVKPGLWKGTGKQFIHCCNLWTGIFTSLRYYHS